MKTDLEAYFDFFRQNIVGNNAEFDSPYGRKKIVYADWIASGRLYAPIEQKLSHEFGTMVGNTHSEASETGTSMTHAYHLAHQIIKKHVNACQDDVIITAGSGMTGMVNKFQRILGLKVPEQARKYCNLPDDIRSYCKNIAEEDRPVVFITHMEHHSNHTSWLETIADVVVLEPGKNMRVSAENLEKELKKYSHRKLKIGSFSACSNVTGLMPPVHQLARIMHQNGGYCFVDFAASAPYTEIDMHPADPLEALDAIYFSPHKFLGGPGSSGVLIFSKELYKNQVPDQPGGGTVSWTNRWNEYSYLEDVEAREDGGTPAFMQTFKAALSIRLKEQMRCEKIHAREKELTEIAFRELEKINGLHILAGQQRERIGVFSFYSPGIHHNLIVKLLNDRYGIQVRGGCSCAGTYGHYLLQVNIIESKKITTRIDQGDQSLKPGWVRLSIHPTMTNDELFFITNAIKEVIENVEKWQEDYVYDASNNEFYHKKHPRKSPESFQPWFELR